MSVNSRERFLYNFIWEYDRSVDLMPALERQRLIVEQLRREASVRRINVSQAVDELKKFVEEHKDEDCLVSGFRPPNRNHLVRKSLCSCNCNLL